MSKSINQFYLLAIFLIVLFGCETKNTRGLKQLSKINADSISFELCKLYSSDQGIRNRELFNSTDNSLIEKLDSSNFADLMNIVKQIGVPKEEKLGLDNFANECVEGAFGAIMLHNPHVLINDPLILDFFIDLVKKGDLKAEALATILDKYYWSKSGGERVLYGSQFGIPCLEEREETNTARKNIGLPPLNDDEFRDCF